MYKFMVLFLFLIIFASCGHRLSYEVPVAQAVDMMPMATPPAPQAMAPGFGLYFWGDEAIRLTSPVDDGATGARLIIQNASVQLESENFDEAVELLRHIPAIFEGYSESERLFAAHSQRQFEIVMRIPAADFDNALERIKEVAYTRSFTTSSEDVTDLFYDTESRLGVRRIEEERILALIDQTTELADLIELERRLASTRLQIERYEFSLADLADRIAFSTIQVHMWDVEDVPVVVAAATFGERIGGAFGSSIDGTKRAIQFILVVLAGAVVPVTLISVIAFVAVKLYRRKHREASIPQNSL